MRWADAGGPRLGRGGSAGSHARLSHLVSSTTMNPTNSARASEVDELLATLTHRYCRATVSYFLGSSEDVATVEELADALADQFSADREAVALRLFHVTLPRLAGTGLLTFDATERSVRYEGVPRLDPIVESLLADDVSVR